MRVAGVMLISLDVPRYFEMVEFLRFWERVEEVRRRAVEEVEGLVRELADYIASSRREDLDRVRRELGVELELDVEVDARDPLLSRPVLYVWKDGGVDDELIEHVYEMLGNWARDARLLVKPRPRGR